MRQRRPLLAIQVYDDGVVCSSQWTTNISTVLANNDTFKRRLVKFWYDQDVLYNYKKTHLRGIRNRSTIV